MIAGRFVFFVTFLLTVTGCETSDRELTGPRESGRAPYSGAPDAQAPAACWDFDEAGGPAAGDGCGAHDGSIDGATWTSGRCGAALAYDGVDDCTLVPGGDWLTLFEGTLEAWVWIDPAETRARIISTEAPGWQNGLHINWGSELSDNSSINGGIWGGIHSNVGGGHYVETYIDDVARGAWHFIAFAWDGDANTLLAFVDGQASMVTSAHDGIEFTGEPLAIGCWTDNGVPASAWMEGLVDEVKIYDRALSIAELTAHYASACGALERYLDIKPGSCPNPINPGSRGKLPVAILGTGDFDVQDIDVSSVLLEGVAPIRSAIEDVSAPSRPKDECDCIAGAPDGYDDLTLKFNTQDILAAISPLGRGAERTLTIRGRLLDGTEFRARDCVVVVGGHDNGPYGGRDRAR